MANSSCPSIGEVFTTRFVCMLNWLLAKLLEHQLHVAASNPPSVSLTRGTVSVRSLKTSSSSVAFLQEPLTNQQLQNLKVNRCSQFSFSGLPSHLSLRPCLQTAARNGENYFIRARSRLTDIHGDDDVEDGGDAVFVSTLISAVSQCTCVSTVAAILTLYTL